MFTGIIEELGKVQSITQNRITIQANTVTEGTKLGDSIAVNGVCLTVTGINSNGFDADISPETIKVTALEYLKQSSLVNLERAVIVGSRLGGHIVSGHIDGKGRCLNINKEGHFYTISFDVPAELSRYIAQKGSVAIDGISLTIAEIVNNKISIAVIPHTFENTNLQILKIGSFVNIETDILSKYVEKFLSTSDNKSRISMEFLTENGF